MRAWRRLPKTVRQIIVLRDTPTAGDNTPDCIERAMRRRKQAGHACALSRAKVLPIDPRRSRRADCARRASTSST